MKKPMLFSLLLLLLFTQAVMSHNGQRFALPNSLSFVMKDRRLLQPDAGPAINLRTQALSTRDSSPLASLMHINLSLKFRISKTVYLRISVL